MRRRSLLVVLVAVVLVAVAAAGCAGTETTSPPATAAAARPHTYPVDWVERYPPSGEGLVFRVRSFSVLDRGWSAEIVVENRSGVSWEIPTTSFRQQFGVMVFATGSAAELDRRNRDGDLPTLRAPETYRPALTDLLGAGATWSGTLSGRETLPAGLFVRFSFGPFSSVGDPPSGTRSSVAWITDHTVVLR